MAKDLVILLHGILRSPVDMLPLALYLKRCGYDAINILYPSRTKSIEDIVDFVHEKIVSHKEYDAAKILHFVSHSMGGLITRYYIAKHRPKNLGRVVMLSPPNTGSELADFLAGHKIYGPVYKRAFGPAGQQLLTACEHATGPVDYPLGIIAGSRSLNPIASWTLTGEHDGIVPVERTKISGMADHVTVPATHALIMFRPDVMRMVASFLKKGNFGFQTDSKKDGSSPRL